MRALKLVKVGGVVCYSTCTLNPIEDEAVVAAALATIQSKKRNETAKEKEGIVELVDWPNLPGDLIRRPGISSWKVAEYRDNNTSTNDDGADDDLEEIPRLHWYDSYDAVVTENGKKNSSLVSTMWPPSFEKAEALHLERCIRLWPQDRDTGGFFLALIRKNADYE
jgi:16S rRNA C967 or C1407 C5-methylase (RsmB/RsmF family)